MSRNIQGWRKNHNQKCWGNLQRLFVATSVGKLLLSARKSQQVMQQQSAKKLKLTALAAEFFAQAKQANQN